MAINVIHQKEKDGMLFTLEKHQIARHSGKVTSKVWNSFKVVGILTNGVNNITNFAQCKNCMKFVQYNRSSTTQLSRHKCDGWPQFTIEQCLRPRVTKEDITAIRDAAAKFIALDIRPFYALEGDGLKDLLLTFAKITRKYGNLNKLEINRLLPRRLTISRYIHDKFLQSKAMMIDDFQRALEFPGGFSCTTDIYTDCHKSNSYLGITASLNLVVNGKIVHKRYVMNLDKLDAVSKTGEAIFGAIKACFASFQISEEQLTKQIIWVTDRGANIRNALEKCTRLNCYAHILNNIVKYMCDKETDIKKMVSDGSALVRYMKTAAVDNDKLKSSLKPYCDTRWNTVHIMFNSIEINYTEIFQILSEKERSSYTHRNVTDKIRRFSQATLKSICTFLELFRTITTEIEGDKYETIHMVWPAWKRIMTHLESKDCDVNIVRNMKVLGRKYIFDNLAQIQPAIEHKVAVFLHPLLKKLNMIDRPQTDEIIRYVTENVPVLENRMPNQNEQTTVTENSGICLFSDFLNDPEPAESRSEIQKYIDFHVEQVCWLFLSCMIEIFDI